MAFLSCAARFVNRVAATTTPFAASCVVYLSATCAARTSRFPSLGKMDSPHWGRHCMSSWSLSFHVSRFPDAHRKTTFCEHGTRTWPLSDAVCKRRGVDSSSVRTTVAKITRARSTISTHRRSPLVSTMAVAVALAEVLGSSALIGTRSAPRGRRPAAPAASHTAASRTAPSAQRRTLPPVDFALGGCCGSSEFGEA